MSIEVMAFIVGGVSLLVGVVSIVLALVAIHHSRAAEKDSQEALSEIREKAALIETVVSNSQRELQSTITEILKKTTIPDTPSPSDQLMLSILPQMLQGPEALERLIELGERIQQSQEDEE